MSSEYKRNSARVNLVISVTMHALLIFGVFFFAAREGYLGRTLKEFTAVIVPKEKPPEQPKPPPPPPPIEPPKEEQPKVVEQPKVAVAAPPSGPPSSEPPAAPAVAPAAVIPADFAFGDGAKPVVTGTNAAVAYYQQFAEYTLRSNWVWPDDESDTNFVDEVEVKIDDTGAIKTYSMKKSSGNKKWDTSVLQAMASTKTIGRLPPKGFPMQFTVRFDMVPGSEPVSQ